MSIVCIGNCPPPGFCLENETSALTDADDALVTAIYLARSGTQVSLLCTATSGNIGALKNSLRLRKIDSDLINEASIDTLFSEGAVVALKSKLENFDYLYLTGKILSELTIEGRESLFGLLQAIKESGVKIIFDCNHQNTNWLHDELAAKAYQQFLTLTDISLPNYIEEALLFKDRDVAELIARHHRLGVGEIAVKNGKQSNWLSTKPEKSPREFPLEQVQEEIDVAGAGEAFNAAYIATRLSGKTYCGSIKQGQILAGDVVINENLVIPE